MKRRGRRDSQLSKHLLQTMDPLQFERLIEAPTSKKWDTTNVVLYTGFPMDMEELTLKPIIEFGISNAHEIVQVIAGKREALVNPLSVNCAGQMPLFDSHASVL